MKKKSTNFRALVSFLSSVPAIEGTIGKGTFKNGCWWVKFKVDVEDPLAWRVIQELGHVLNYLSLDERLPTVFMPVSPPPYLNGGTEFLSWVIESTVPKFTPGEATRFLRKRLPSPVHHARQWRL